MLTSSTQLQNMSFHVVERTRTSSKCQKMKNARAKRAKILFFIVKYGNLWGFCCRRRRSCLSSLLSAARRKRNFGEKSSPLERDLQTRVLYFQLIKIIKTSSSSTVSSICSIIIKITISSIVIGLKNSYFPLILLSGCYQTVCYRTVQQANHIQSCSLNQPITFKVVV